MHVTAVSQEELVLLILGLRRIVVKDHAELHRQLLLQLEHELATRYGMTLHSDPDPPPHPHVPKPGLEP